MYVHKAIKRVVGIEFRNPFNSMEDCEAHRMSMWRFIGLIMEWPGPPLLSRLASLLKYLIPTKHGLTPCGRPELQQKTLD